MRDAITITRRAALLGGAAVLAVAGAQCSPPRSRGKAQGPVPGGRLPALPAAMIGINEGFLYGASDWAVDLWDAGVFQSVTRPYPYDTELEGSIFKRTVDGRPTVYAPGETEIYWVSRNVVRDAARAGVYTLTYPAGMTVVVRNGPGAGAGIKIVKPFARGTGKILLPVRTIDDVLNNAAYVALTFSGPIPRDGLKFSLVRDGETATGYYHPQAVAPLSALGRVHRTMSNRGVNNDVFKMTPDGRIMYTRPAAARYVGPAGTAGRECVEMQVDVCNKASQHLWYNCSTIDRDDLIAAEAAHVAATLAPNLAVFVELSNELWNFGFAQSRHTQYQGAVAGLCPADADPRRLVPETIVYNSGAAVTDVTNYSCAAGDRILMRTAATGLSVYQCLAAQPAGVPVAALFTHGATTPDGNWRLIYTATDLATAGHRWIASRSRRVWAIWDAAFAAAGRPRPLHVVGHQAAVPIASFVGHVLDWDDTFRFTDRVAIAPYWGGGVGAVPNELGNYTVDTGAPPGSHPWTRREKDLVASDPAAFIDAFFAAAPAVVDSAVAACDDRRRELADYLENKGWSAGGARICSYEANWHVVPSNYPAADRPGWAADGGVLRAIMRDPRYGAMTTRYFTGLLAGGGEHVAFDRLGGPLRAYADHRTSWAFQEFDADRPPRYLALAALNAAHR